MAGILYLYAQTYRAGSVHARRAVQMLAMLRAAGHPADLLTFPGGDPWPDGLVDRVFRTASIPFGRSLPTYGFGPRRCWATLVLAVAAVRLVLRRHYTVVHCADRALRVGGFVSWLFGTRFVFEWNTTSGRDLVRWLRQRPKRFRRSVRLILSDVPYPFSRLRATGLAGRIATIPMLPHPRIRRQMMPAVRMRGTVQPFRLTVLSMNRPTDALAPILEALPTLTDAYPNISVRICFGHTDRQSTRFQALLTECFGVTAEVLPEPCDAQTFTEAVQGTDLVFLPACGGVLPPPTLLDLMTAGVALLAVRCRAYTSLLNDSNAALVAPCAADVAAAVIRHMASPLLCAEHADAVCESIAADRSYTLSVAALRSCYAFALSEPTE